MRSRVRRWGSWARLLKERYGRVARRQAAAPMVLVHFRNGVAVGHTWRPQVWVTVRAGAGLQVNPAQVLRSATREIVQSQQAAIPQQAPAPMQVVQAVRREFVLQTRTATSRDRAVSSPQTTPQAHAAIVAETIRTRRESTVFTESIARQVIRRTQRLEELLVRTARRETEHRLDHIVRRNSRREEMPQPAPMVLRPAAATPAPAPPKGSEEQTARERETVREFAPAPAININSLTDQVMDQIDRRVVAWRERMGKF